MAKEKTPIDTLYDLPLSEFVAARNALAKELSKSGDKTRAAEVKALVKPSSSAFALNQVVRKHPDEMNAFLRASDRLARAQLRAMSGSGTNEDFQNAVAEQRDALEEVLQLAAPILEEAGQSAKRPVLEKIARTMRAIVLDESQRDLLEAGRLSAELLDQGFDALAAALGAGVAARPDNVVPIRRELPAPDTPEGTSKGSRAERMKEAREELERAKAERLRAERERAEGEETARGKAEKLKAERESAAAKKAKQAEARKVLRDAEKVVAAAREKVEGARGEMEAADQEVIDAKRILIGAERIAAQRREKFLERQHALRAAEGEAEVARNALLEVEG